MFAGHIGAALAIGRVERRINVGALIFAALLLDVALWLLVLFGWETAAISANFASTHQPDYTFPYSHGLLAAIAWSTLAGAAAIPAVPRLKTSKSRAAGFVAAAVFSHWLLDAMVHVPELPLAGESSLKVGLGMWRTMPVALAVETLIAFAGLGLFLNGARLSRAKKLGLTALTVSLVSLTVLGMTVAPPPPSGTAMAASSLAAIAVVCPLAGWLGKQQHIE
jgi:hypothetical protein